MPQRRRSRAEWNRIRELFLGRRASYGVAEVIHLAGISEIAVHEAIDEGTIAPIPCGEETRLAWEDVVALGLEHRWTYRTLTEALRGVRGAPLPQLVRVVPRPVLLPRYQWKILSLVAAQRARTERRDITVSDLVEEAISTAVLTKIEEWQPLASALPGLRAAANWPFTD
jgi:hypothetical protein